MKTFFLKLGSESCPLKEDLEALNSLDIDTAITVGNFDGFHLGHKYLVDKLKDNAHKRGLKSLVLTFCPHPLKVIAPKLLTCELSDIDEKVELVEREEIDYFSFVKFDEKFSKISARDFLEEILYEKLRCRYLLVGYDWRFGYRREGEIELAREIGEKLGFEVDTVAPFQIEGHIVSSTLIRRLLHEGRLREVKTFLGRNYFIKRKVVSGDGRGSKIGFPTANLKGTDNLCLREGVYAVRVNETYKGVANYGIRPTFGGDKRVLEVHILDFDENIRGRKIKVEFLEFIRPEMKFNSVEELKRQINKDIEIARKVAI